MNDRELKVFVFNNSFVVDAAYTSKVNESYVLTRGRNYKFSRAGEVLVPEITAGVAIFQGGFDGVDVVEVQPRTVVNMYSSALDGFKDIDQETYDSLSKNIQSKYAATDSGVAEDEHEVTVVTERRRIDFDLQVYRGEVVSQMKKIFYGEDYAPRPSMTNFSFVNLSGNFVLAVMNHLYEQERAELTQIRPNFEKSSYRHADKSYDSVSVDYLTEPFTGQTRKVYLRKKNGALYADGRYRMVSDIPDTASRVVISAGDLDSVPLSKDDDENLKIVKGIYRAVFHP